MCSPCAVTKQNAHIRALPQSSVHVVIVQRLQRGVKYIIGHQLTQEQLIRKSNDVVTKEKPALWWGSVRNVTPTPTLRRVLRHAAEVTKKLNGSRWPPPASGWGLTRCRLPAKLATSALCPLKSEI